MALSQQSFPQITARFLQSLEDREEFQGMTEGLNLADKKAMSGKYLSRIMIMRKPAFYIFENKGADRLCVDDMSLFSIHR